MNDRLDSHGLWWGLSSFFALLTGVALWGVTEMDGFAAGFVFAIALLLLLCSGVSAYMALATHFDWRPFRQSPPPPPRAVTPSVVNLEHDLGRLRRPNIRPGERAPED